LSVAPAGLHALYHALYIGVPVLALQGAGQCYPAAGIGRMGQTRIRKRSFRFASLFREQGLPDERGEFLAALAAGRSDTTTFFVFLLCLNAASSV